MLSGSHLTVYFYRYSDASYVFVPFPYLANHHHISIVRMISFVRILYVRGNKQSTGKFISGWNFHPHEFDNRWGCIHSTQNRKTTVDGMITYSMKEKGTQQKLVTFTIHVVATFKYFRSSNSRKNQTPHQSVLIKIANIIVFCNLTTSLMFVGKTRIKQV